MNFNKKQSEFLMNLGLMQVIDGLIEKKKAKRKPPPNKGKRWTKKQRENFARTMANKWAKKKATNG